MERNCKLKVKVSQDAIEKLGIDENSMLETVFKEGVITIRVLSDAEVQEVMHEAEPHEEEYDSMEDAYADGLDDGHVDGYETVFTAEALTRLTEQSFKDLKNASPSIAQAEKTMKR